MPVSAREPCPKCREEGGDRTGDNLVRFEDGGAKCFKCKYTEPKGGKMTARPRSKLTLAEVVTYPIGHAPASRCVSPEVAELYQIRVQHSTTTGEPERVFYPYWDHPKGKMQGAKARRLADKSFMVVGSLPGFFGKQACTGQQALLITEGEEDALAARTILSKGLMDVVSLPNGASIDDCVKADLKFLQKYKRIIICLDNDEVGEAAAEELATFVSAFTEAKIVHLDPEIGKDASDYLIKGKNHEFMRAIKDAEVFEPEGIVNGIDISLDDLIRPIEEGYKTPYPGLNDMLKGIRPAEITTLCAGTGIGKTTLAREITKSLIDQGCSVANVALEDQMGVAAQALVALDMNIPLWQFRFKPPARETIEPSYKKYVANGKTFYYKHFAGMRVDSLIDNLYYYARAKGCDFIILDHLSIVVSNSEVTNERQAIDNVMTKLAKLVVETGVGLIMIVHLKRPSGDKSFSTGGQVSIDDLRGSAAIEQLSWNVIGLERDQQGEDKDFSKIRILKNRTVGFLGIADTLKYQAETGRLLPIELEDLEE